jgi:D-sedoheptulose 7-phosphate isomerase
MGKYRSIPLRTLMNEDDFIRQSLEESARTKRAMIETCSADLKAAADWIAQAMRSGSKLMICGNGGSAADAQHISTEFVVRLTADNNRHALPCIALTTDTSTLTAAANDFGFDQIFARQVEALGRPGDVLIGISTSGKSSNVVKAALAAKDRQIKVIAFLGQERRQFGEIADLCIQIPSPDSQRVQEGHITAGHLLVALVEQRLVGK